MILDDRTTPLGLFNFAESYRHAADRIRASRAKRLPFDDPIRYLYVHAIELYLKSCLRASELTVQEIKNRYGHRFRDLQKACSARGVTFDDEDIEVIPLIDANYLRSRYIETGFRQDASLAALARTCDSLARSSFEFLGTKMIIVRKPSRTPPRLRR